jgi:hypothetical protein
MNLVTITINDLSEVDFDDLFERSKDALAANWPTASVMTDEEKKARRREYMKNYIKNLSRYQKEKRRLKNLERKKNNYHDKTPEEIQRRKVLDIKH